MPVKWYVPLTPEKNDQKLDRNGRAMDRRRVLSDKQLKSLERDLLHGDLTFKELGKKYGVSGQRVQQLNEQRFRADTRARWRRRLEDKLRLRKETLNLDFYNPGIKAFIRASRAYGLKIRPWVSSHRDTAKWFLLVNKNLCALHWQAKPWHQYPVKSGEVHGYYSIHVSPGYEKSLRAGARFRVFILGEGPWRFVIVPRSRIKTSSVNIPISKRSGHNNRKPVVKYERFENRFDLLK